MKNWKFTDEIKGKLFHLLFFGKKSTGFALASNVKLCIRQDIKAKLSVDDARDRIYYQFRWLSGRDGIPTLNEFVSYFEGYKYDLSSNLKTAINKSLGFKFELLKKQQQREISEFIMIRLYNSKIDPEINHYYLNH